MLLPFRLRIEVESPADVEIIVKVIEGPLDLLVEGVWLGLLVFAFVGLPWLILILVLFLFMLVVEGAPQDSCGGLLVFRLSLFFLLSIFFVRPSRKQVSMQLLEQLDDLDGVDFARVEVNFLSSE